MEGAGFEWHSSSRLCHLDLPDTKYKFMAQGANFLHRLLHISGLFLGCLLICTLGAEAILRFALGLGNPVLIAADPACRYILKPDQNVYRFFGHVSINHFGMRSEAVPKQRTPGTLRVLFVGDSMTYGTTQVDQREIFSERVHTALPGIIHRPVEVLNASAGAWAPANELAYLRSRGTFQADVVVLVLNDGDISQPMSSMRDVGDALPHIKPSSAIGELYERYLKVHIFHVKPKIDAGDSVKLDASSVVQENLQVFDQIQQLVARSGARLVVLFVPFRLDFPEIVRQPETTITAWTATHHVPLIDLSATEALYPAKEITLDGIHLNAKGNSIVAQAVEASWAHLVGQ